MILWSLNQPSPNLLPFCTVDTQVQGIQVVGEIIVVVLETNAVKHASECLL